MKKKKKIDLAEWSANASEWSRAASVSINTPEEVRSQIEEHLSILKPDLVNHPPHYKRGGIECIDVIEALDLPFCTANATKYLWRCGAKGSAIEDLRKANWYISREIERLNTERWRVWPVDNRYEVSSFGNVRRAGSMTNRKLIPLKNGYLTIVRYVDKKAICTYVHRMVIETFVQFPIPKPLGVCHNDGIKSNNFLYNLRIDSTINNCRDRYFHGTHFIGERNPRAKFTNSQAEEIKYTQGSEVSVASKFGITRATVGCIRRGESYAGIKLPLDSFLNQAIDIFNGRIQSALRFLWNYDKGNIVYNLQEARWLIAQEIEQLERMKQ